MLSYDVIAYTYHGAVYCDNCKPTPTPGEDPPSPWFGSNENSLAGSTCDNCLACYTPDGWETPEVATGKRYRWSTCMRCNDQQPHRINDLPDLRRRSIWWTLRCRDCWTYAVRFGARHGVHHA